MRSFGLASHAFPAFDSSEATAAEAAGAGFCLASHQFSDFASAAGVFMALEGFTLKAGKSAC